jgi:hypothetical protein
MDYGLEHEGKVFTPNGTSGVSPAENEARNLAIEANELARWAEGPDLQVAYYKFSDRQQGVQYRPSFYPQLAGACVTTWTGVRLGIIISAHVYRHNFGGRMVSLTVAGTNGARYYGRASWDGGDVIRLRKAAR